MDFTDEQHTIWYPGSEKPGQDGLYKRRKVDKITGERGPVEYSLWEDGWWYEGWPEVTSALNHPLRKSHYQPSHWEDFEWCGLMPGSYERPDVQEVKTANFVGAFFGDGEIAAAGQAIQAQLYTKDNPHPESIVTEAGQQQMLDLALEEPAAISEEQQFAADFFGEQP